MDYISKSDIDKSFGKLLKQYRIKNNLTQEQLAEQLGISLKYISRIENGNNGIKTQTLIKCINLLGINPNIIYKDFITHKKVKKDIELSEKISYLTDDKKDFLNSIIDLIINLDLK